MENEIYKKVFIHSESDLPKDENLYIWHEKDSGVIDPLQPLFFAKEIIQYPIH